MILVVLVVLAVAWCAAVLFVVAYTIGEGIEEERAAKRFREFWKEREHGRGHLRTRGTFRSERRH